MQCDVSWLIPDACIDCSTPVKTFDLRIGRKDGEQEVGGEKRGGGEGGEGGGEEEEEKEEEEGRRGGGRRRRRSGHIKVLIF